MRNYHKIYFFVIALFFSFRCSTQQYRIKVGSIFFPISFGQGNVGIERMNINRNASWQFSYNISRGAIAIDAGEVSRNWVTLERTYYHFKTKKTHTFHSFFTEMGKRTEYPGFVHPQPDAIPTRWNYFDISSGIVLGINHSFSKRFAFQIYAGPKFIIATNGTEYLYNDITQIQYSISLPNKVTVGLRFGGSIYYQFEIKKSSG